MERNLFFRICLITGILPSHLPCSSLLSTVSMADLPPKTAHLVQEPLHLDLLVEVLPGGAQVLVPHGLPLHLCSVLLPPQLLVDLPQLSVSLPQLLQVPLQLRTECLSYCEELR